MECNDMVKLLDFRAAVSAYETHLSDYYEISASTGDRPDPKKSFEFNGTWCLRNCWGDAIAQVDCKNRVWVGR